MKKNGNGDGIASITREERWARSVGWFSIGLGLAQILAPRAIGAAVGLRAGPGLMRLIGLREVVTGVGILSQSRPTGWLSARVGGDAMDLALLGGALATGNRASPRIAAVAAAVAGVTALDVACTRRFRNNPDAAVGTTRFRKTIIINRPPEDVYRFWRDFENLPRIMPHLLSVRDLGNSRSHWVARAPVGSSVEWDAELTADLPNSQLSWRSCEGADVDNTGTVRFERATGNRGTIVKVEMQYRPVAGILGTNVAKALGQSPEKQVKVDLLRFKQLLETGEIATTEGQTAGRTRSTSRKFDDLIRK